MLNRILIIEDNEDNMELCELVLQGQFEIITAYNGTDGLNKIYSEKPELVLLDLSLPDMDGLDIVKKVRADATIKDIPVIALTAHSMRGDKERALNAGCNKYIEKPFEIKTLVNTIKSQLAIPLEDQ